MKYRHDDKWYINSRYLSQDDEGYLDTFSPPPNKKSFRDELSVEKVPPDKKKA